MPYVIILHGLLMSVLDQSEAGERMTEVDKLHLAKFICNLYKRTPYTNDCVAIGQCLWTSLYIHYSNYCWQYQTFLAKKYNDDLNQHIHT